MPKNIQEVDGKFIFKNVHGNYEYDFEELIRIFNDPNKVGFDAYNDTSDKIRDILIRAKNLKKTIRFCGSLWSLSEIPYNNQINIFSYNNDDNRDMQFSTFLENEDCTGIVINENLLFTQCGNRIKELHEVCENANKSLKVSGASNGQTIAGAIGTGVHGSSLHDGAIQDTVLAIHIICGPTLNDSVLIQANSNQIINETFAKKIKAKLISDDDMFNAALVGLGSFGIVHGVIVEVEDLFHLANHFIKIDKLQPVIDFCNTMSLEKSGIEVRSGIAEKNLYHVKFYINQYSKNIRAEIIYKIKGLSLSQPGFMEYNKDFLFGFVQILTTIAPGLIPSKMDEQLPDEGREFGKLSEIFGDTKNLRDKQFACSIAVNSSDAATVIGKILQIAESHKNIPALMSLRFVPKSKATLAFTKHTMNCIIGFDGIETSSTKSFVDTIYNNLATIQINHTWHWGKYNIMDKVFVEKMYKDELPIWKREREKLLGDNQSIFPNKYTTERGLT